MSTEQSTDNENSKVRASAPLSRWIAAGIAVLLLILSPGQYGFWRRVGPDHPVLWSVALLALGLSAVAIVALLRRRDWAPWPALCSLTWSGTIAAWAYANVGMPSLELAIVVASFVLTIFLPTRRLCGLTLGMRAYYLAVASLTTYVAFWGLFFPNGTGWNLSFLADNFDSSLPFNVAVPTLHARMIGSLYLAATVVCVLCAISRGWAEARLGTWMILLWTGSLLGITLTHSEVFDWNKPSVWFWFVAYIGFPAVAAWLLVRAPRQQRAASPRELSGAAVSYLTVQGVALVALAVVLQLSPPMAANIWPWAILPLLSRFYSAPLVTFGASSLIGSRSHSWYEVRTLAAALAVGSFALGVASAIHRDKFDANGPAAWVWFGSLAIIFGGNLTVAVRSLSGTRSSAVC